MKAIVTWKTVREIMDGFDNQGENGVTAMKGNLNIRPAYQREFVYKEAQQKAVIASILNDMPLNSMYWVKNPDGTFEVLDGQQRTMSICNFVSNGFPIDTQLGVKTFNGLTKEEQEQILNYRLLVYVCEGTELEKLQWFKTINTQGEVLTNQELRNACYTGSWLADAKRKFSSSNCPALKVAQLKDGALVKGVPNRQEILEKVLFWFADSKGLDSKKDLMVESVMADNRNQPDAMELWDYFRDVFDWVKTTFVKYRKEMKGVEWGLLYNRFHQAVVDPIDIEAEIGRLMADDDVTKKSGVFTYVLEKNPKVLSLRAFTDKQKREAFEKQGGVCPLCEGKFALKDMAGDHVIPWSAGGKTTSDNLQLLCKKCNLKKGAISG